jgi:hypothetical protein
MTTRELIVAAANELYEHSNMALAVRCDPALPMPGFSLVETDHGGLQRPTVVVNPEILPACPHVVAHVMGHEWGHHYLRHLNPASSDEGDGRARTPEERRRKELEADAYAAGFVKARGYDVRAVEAFIREHPVDLEERLRTLRDTPASR